MGKEKLNGGEKEAAEPPVNDSQEPGGDCVIQMVCQPQTSPQSADVSTLQDIHKYRFKRRNLWQVC